jgi:hypothetical protein
MNGSSNQAFELWYVLHFQFLQSAIRRDGYFTILSKIFGFRYEKNSVKIVEELFKKGNVQQAIKWAAELEKMHKGKTPSESCPSTNVYKLVDRLLVYSKRKIDIG